jgi:hypothetical protein
MKHDIYENGFHVEMDLERFAILFDRPDVLPPSQDEVRKHEALSRRKPRVRKKLPDVWEERWSARHAA